MGPKLRVSLLVTRTCENCAGNNNNHGTQGQEIVQLATPVALEPTSDLFSGRTI